MLHFLSHLNDNTLLFTSHAAVMWLIIGFVCLVVEMGHPGLFFFLSFFFGALCALLSTLCSVSVPGQATLFVGATVLSFFILRQWVSKTLQAKEKKQYQTNVYALEGQHGTVLQAIHSPHKGIVKIGGERWLASSFDNEIVNLGSTVEIIRVQGAHLIVKKINHVTSRRSL